MSSVLTVHIFLLDFSIFLFLFINVHFLEMCTSLRFYLIIHLNLNPFPKEFKFFISLEIIVFFSLLGKYSFFKVKIDQFPRLESSISLVTYFNLEDDTTQV